MKGGRGWLAAAGILAIAAAGTGPAGGTEPFYLSLLQSGIAAYTRGNSVEAAGQIRLAAFGLLDEPPLLARALAYLALAQSKSADVEGFRATYRRLTEIENRFQAYASADLPPEVRSELEQQIVHRIPAATLRLDGAFAELVPAKPPAVEKGRRRGRQPAAPTTRAPAAAVPAAPPPAAAPAPATPPAPAPAAPALAAADQARLAEARRQLSQARVAGDLDRALELAREVADAYPADRGAQHLVAEIAYRASRWSEAATYFERGGEPAQPTLRFYMAVALYEAGRPEAAAAVLERALPNLARTPFVDRYVERILRRPSLNP